MSLLREESLPLMEFTLPLGDFTIMWLPFNKYSIKYYNSFHSNFIQEKTQVQTIKVNYVYTNTDIANFVI